MPLCCFTASNTLIQGSHTFDHFIKFNRVASVLEIREKSGNLRKEEESQGILTGCLIVKVSTLLKLTQIAVSAKMLYEEVMENSLRSGRSQGNVRENGNRKKVATLFKLTIMQHLLSFGLSNLSFCHIYLGFCKLYFYFVLHVCHDDRLNGITCTLNY